MLLMKAIQAVFALDIYAIVGYLTITHRTYAYVLGLFLFQFSGVLRLLLGW